MVWKMKYYKEARRKKNNVRTVTWRRADWIGHILRKNCLLRHVIEGKIEGTGRRGRRRKQLLVGIEELRGCWKLKEKTLDCLLWRACFWRGYGPVIRLRDVDDDDDDDDDDDFLGRCWELSSLRSNGYWKFLVEKKMTRTRSWPLSCHLSSNAKEWNCISAEPCVFMGLCWSIHERL